LVERSEQLGARALERLRSELHAAGYVRGRGLFVGIELSDAELAARTQRALRDRGVLVGRGGRAGNVLILAPPLVIEEHVLDSGLDAIVETLG
jgi:4-aminobutyrate aminotransferase